MLQALIGPVAGLLDKFIPDAGEKMAIAHELSTMACLLYTSDAADE